MHATFGRWDEETKTYPPNLRRTSLDATERLANMFVAGVIGRGIKTDQAVRGRGYPKTDTPYQTTGVNTAARAEIERLKTAHVTLIREAVVVESKSWVKKVEEFFSSWRGILTAVGIVVAIAGLVLRFFGVF
jgi:hypothetical protein